MKLESALQADIEFIFIRWKIPKVNPQAFIIQWPVSGIEQNSAGKGI